MDVTAELTRLSGLQQLQAIFAGKTGYAGIVKTLDLHPRFGRRRFRGV